MMPKSKYHVAALIAGSFSLGASVACGAEAYPTRPVRFVLGPGPSSGTDIMARGIAQKLTERLGQTVLVENRTGAGGTVAVASVVKAAPDGYTILFVSGSLVIHPAVYRKLPYDVVRDLAPIMLIGVVPQVIVVHPSLPARNMRELIALAKSRPGQINYGSGGVGSTGHLAGELLQSMAGVRLVHVPYKGAGPAAVDLIGGQIEMLVTSAVNALQHERSGRVRPLAVTTARRSLAMPDVPTVAEAALPGYELMTWYGLLAPAGTAREAIDRLNRETTAVLKLADVQSRLAADGVEPAPDTPEQFSALIKSELARIAKIIREGNIRIE
jgi:tripartite-type tricarboxylate transporter receptor subunit TctC